MITLFLPQFVQGGDTGELVAASYNLFVPHPPGYPLWLWLQYAWTHLIPVNSVFWRASLLSTFFSLGALCFIGNAVKRNLVTLFLAVPFLALSTAFLEAAFLPDVFSFHALLTAAIGGLYLFSKTDSDWRLVGIPVIFALGLAHHHTIIFLTPVIIGLFLETASRTARRKLIYSTLAGLLTACSLYLTLFFCQPESPFSWGTINNLKALWNHFLRSDYGTFRLAADSTRATPTVLLYFIKESLVELSAPILVALWVLLKNKTLLRNRRLIVWGITCLLSLTFFFLSNIIPTGMGAEVLRRFHVMPLVQITLLCAFVMNTKRFEKKELMAIIFLGAINIAVLGTNAASFGSLGRDSVIEDHSINLLNQAATRKPAIIIAGGDNSYFGLRYAQAVLGLHKDIAVISPALFFHPWYLKKIQLLIPDFKLRNPEKIWQTRAFHIDADIIEPNLEKISVVVNKGYQDGKEYQVTFLPLGRVLKKGSGLFFDESIPLLTRTSYNDRPVGPQAYSKGLLYAEYAHYFLAKGMHAWKKGRQEEAKNTWRMALHRVPYAFPALVNLCTYEKTSACSAENVQRVQLMSEGFF